MEVATTSAVNAVVEVAAAGEVAMAELAAVVTMEVAVAMAEVVAVVNMEVAVAGEVAR